MGITFQAEVYFYGMKNAVLSKKSTLTLLAIFLLATFPGKSIELKVAATETNGLVQFLISCERNNERSSLYQMLMASKYNTDQTKSMLQKWDNLEKHNTLNFEGFPENRHNANSVVDLIVIQSVRAKDAKELAQNCSGYFTQSELKKFRDIVLYFEPIYRELVWQPHLKEIKAKVKEVKDFVIKNNIEKMFNQAAAFYGTKWENDMPFFVMVNPLPGRVQHTSARPMGQVLIADLVLNEKDMSGWLGVVFHEICHVLYANQPREIQESLEAFFTKHPSENYRLPAYNWLNEAMATALGNGWLVEKINGGIDPNNWYQNTYIDKFAHVAYPLVKSYVEKGQTMDAVFVDSCVAMFDKNFKDINRQTEHLFTYINMVADTMPHESYEAIFKHFHVRSFGCETPFETAGLEKAGAGAGTKVFVITSEKEKKLNRLNDLFGLKITPSEKSAVYYFLEENGSNYFVLSLSSISDLAKAFELFSKKPVFTDKTGVLAID